MFISHYGIAQSQNTCADCVKNEALNEANAKVREKTGYNDGDRIFAYLRAGGMKNPERVSWRSRAWCGAFVSFVLKKCGYSLSNISNPLATAQWAIAKGTIRKGIPQMGDLVLYNFSGRKIGADHIEICYAYNPNPRFPFFTAIGGNTSDPTHKEGDGVYMKPSRLKRQISFIYPLKNLSK